MMLFIIFWTNAVHCPLDVETAGPIYEDTGSDKRLISGAFELLYLAKYKYKICLETQQRFSKILKLCKCGMLRLHQLQNFFDVIRKMTNLALVASAAN